MPATTRLEIENCLSPDGTHACFIDLKVQPGAKKESLSGLYDAKHLKVHLRARPVDGAANESLLDFLQEALGVRKSEVQIVSGHKSRIKRVRLELPVALVCERLESLLVGS
jgi:uncharacterized protein (TIGR00251 family)